MLSSTVRNPARLLRRLGAQASALLVGASAVACVGERFAGNDAGAETTSGQVRPETSSTASTASGAPSPSLPPVSNSTASVPLPTSEAGLAPSASFGDASPATSASDAGAHSSPDSQALDAAVSIPDASPVLDAGDGSERDASDSQTHVDAAGSSDPEYPDAEVPDTNEPCGAACQPVCEAPAVTGPGNVCYWFGGSQLAFDEARTTCQGRGQGWDLVTISSAAENEFVTAQLSRGTWIGALRVGAANEWRWLDQDASFYANGSPLNNSYVVWQSGEPTGGAREQCARYVRANGQWRWADNGCSLALDFVCQKR